MSFDGYAKFRECTLAELRAAYKVLGLQGVDRSGVRDILTNFIAERAIALQSELESLRNEIAAVMAEGKEEEKEDEQQKTQVHEAPSGPSSTLPQ